MLLLLPPPCSRYNQAMTIPITPEMERELEQEAARQNTTPEQLAITALIAGLKNRRVPQTLDELAPRTPLPPGKTLKDVLREFAQEHPSNESDEEVARTLEALS